MRELKFRMWIDRNTLDSKPFMAYNVLPTPSSLIMQYIGLKDKNGKEVYEGDIVSTCQKLFGEVVYNPLYTRYMVRDLISREAKFDFSILHGDEVEVLGNIHENPELLRE